MAKKSRATFQKREKERARQQKQHDKAQRGSSAPPRADDTSAIAGIRPGPQAVPTPWEEAPPADAVAVATA